MGVRLEICAFVAYISGISGSRYSNQLILIGLLVPGFKEAVDIRLQGVIYNAPYRRYELGN